MIILLCVFLVLGFILICLGSHTIYFADDCWFGIGVGILVAGMISFIAAFILFAANIGHCLNYTHTVTTRYEVVCDDNGNFNVSSDIELPESAVQLINEEAEYMKKWDVDSFSGAIRITYSCTGDSRIHDEACYCTESELCKYCSAHSELEKAELLR